MQPAQAVKNNPNAAVAGGGGFLAVFITWLLGNVFHYSISAEDAAIIATAISTVALAIGRTGIHGMLNIIWNGRRGQAAPAQSAPTPTAHG